MSTDSHEEMTPLTKEEAEVFERRLDMAREKLQEIDAEIERELDEVRDRIAALREKRTATLKMYDAACTMLGIQNQLAGVAGEGEPEDGSGPGGGD